MRLPTGLYLLTFWLPFTPVKIIEFKGDRLSTSVSAEDISKAKTEGSSVALRTPKQIAWAKYRANKVGVISTFVVLFFIFLAYGAPLVTRIFNVTSTDIYLDLLDDNGNPVGKFGGMSFAHPFGIEPGAGRDVFAMLLYGSRISFSVAIISSVSAIGIGMLLGITAGYFRGKVDAVIGRFSDLLFAFPSFFMIIALSKPMVERVESLGIVRDNGARLTVLIIFFVFFGWTGFARLIRSQALSLRERDFIMASQAQGASNWRIITK